MPTRRQVMKGGVATGAAAAVAGPQLLTRTAEAAAIPGTSIPKYQTPLFILPAMPEVASVAGRNTFHYVARRFQQQVLPAGMPSTTVQGFGHPNGTLNHAPGPTLECIAGRPSQVRWENGLKAANGNFLPQILPVDPTLHWSNPPGGVDGRDSTPVFTETPGPYTGPHTLIVHHHGSHDFQESDGYPEAWYLPDANNIPADFARVGSFYDQFKAEAKARWGVDWPAGSLISVYPNDQRAITMWFHDHSLGTTRLGPHSGLLGFSILRGGSGDLPAGVLPGPAPKAGDPPGTKYREIMLAITNPSFNDDGSLFFPDRNLTHPGPYIPDSDIPPIWNPNRVGDTVAVNGNTWPFLEVEARRYRFRILNSSNIAQMMLKVVQTPGQTTPATPIWVIGSDGGFLEAPKNLGTRPLRILTSERYDIIVDFTGMAGATLHLVNEGGNVDTVGQVMQFRVVPPTSPDTTTPPDQLTLPAVPRLGNPTVTRRLSLQQVQSVDFPSVVAHFQLGNIAADGTNTPRNWADPVTETPRLNDTEMWEFVNLTAGQHAIHVHLIEFEVVNRQNLATGAVTQPEPWETGLKDTVWAPPGPLVNGANQPMSTRIKLKMDRKVRMVWHCHFIDHEDHEMMRPFVVT